MKIVWQTIWIIILEILGVQGLKQLKLKAIQEIPYLNVVIVVTKVL